MIHFSALASRLLERIQTRLAGASALPLLSLLGLVSGVGVGVLIVLLRLLIEWTQAGFLPDSDPENYEAMSWQMRIAIVIGGSCLLAAIYALFRSPAPRVGIIHVLERLAYHEGLMPLKNALLQFFGTAIAIVSGHSVGREGPSVHIGSAAASLMGQYFRLPNNSIRTLVACGAAAAIASSFNTPLAGVIFAMEVILMEYSISGFTPVILAAVSATAISRLVFPAETLFLVPALELVSIWELCIIVLMGIAIGGFAAAFIRTLRWVTVNSLPYHISIRLLLAGVGIALCSCITPEVMGVGYDTVNMVFSAELAIGLMCLIALMKLLATAISVGLGVPGGMIGPSLAMGALLGGVVGQLVNLLPGLVSHPGLYAMLGMGAMMGATLQAPLAALVALLELTANQNIIFPGMLAIVTANLAAKELFGEGSVFLSQMKVHGLDYRNDPVAQSLRRFAVASVMNRDFAIVNTQLSHEQANKIIEQNPTWLVMRREDRQLLMPAADLARYLKENTLADSELANAEELDLLEIPSKRLQLAPVLQQATLQQALKLLNESDAEALYVIQPIGTVADRIFGIVTPQDIEQSYQQRHSDF